VYGWLTAAQVM